MSLMLFILSLLGGAVVVGAMMLGQPIVLIVLFALTGIAFAIFASRYREK